MYGVSTSRASLGVEMRIHLNKIKEKPMAELGIKLAVLDHPTTDKLSASNTIERYKQTLP